MIESAVAPPPPASRASPKRDPTALDLVDAAQLLTAAGGQRITPAMISADVEAGAPLNGDGTLNLIHYAAWLVREMASTDD